LGSPVCTGKSNPKGRHRAPHEKIKRIARGNAGRLPDGQKGRGENQKTLKKVNNLGKKKKVKWRKEIANCLGERR